MLARMFVELADNLVEDSTWWTRCSCSPTGAPRSQVLEVLQAAAHHGPCVDCYRSGAPVADVDSPDSRWPHLVPRAVAAGFLAAQALTMRRSIPRC